MKKNYFLMLVLTLCLPLISNGQVLVSEGFSYADGSLVGNGGWANEGGTTGDFQVTSGQAVVQHKTASEDVKLAFSSVSGDVYVGFDFSVDDLGSPYSGSDNEYFAHLDFKARMDIVPPSGGGDFSVGIASNASTADATWASDLTFATSYRAIIKFDQLTGTAQLWISPTASTDTSILGATKSAATVKEFELRQSDSSEDEVIRVDDLMIGQTFDDVITFVASTTPELSIGGFTENQVFSPETTEVPLNVSLNNFTLSADDGSGATDNSGDGYIKGTSTIGGVVEVISVFTTAFEDFEVEAGKDYILTMELVNNDGTSLSPAVISSVTFSVASYEQAATISEIRSGTEDNYYELTGEAIMTFDTGNSRNQKYIQDASGAILIDDSAGIISTSYNAGDGISGIKGKLSSFSGVFQFIPQVDPGAASNTGIRFSSETLTIAELKANFENYESEWITINDVTFSAADGTKTFDSREDYEITDGTNTLVFRTAFSDADLIGEVIPSSSVNITGPASEFNGTAQIFGISLANIVLGVEKNTLLGFSIYPNPVNNNTFTITSNSISKKVFAVYNLLGKKVLSSSFSGVKSDVDVTAISSGMYILKVTEDGKTATKKLVIK
jgi:hypothetical protein